MRAHRLQLRDPECCGEEWTSALDAPAPEVAVASTANPGDGGPCELRNEEVPDCVEDDTGSVRRASRPDATRLVVDALGPHRGDGSGNGRYLYAVVCASRVNLFYGRVGINGGNIYTIVQGELAAVVSDVPKCALPSKVAHVLAHQEVLRRLMTETTPLPVAFGVIADGPAAVRRMLSMNQTVIMEQLARVVGKAEMNVRVLWSVPDLFEHLVDTDQEARALRDRLYLAGRRPSSDEEVLLGETFVRALDRARDACGSELLSRLARECYEISDNELQDEHEVIDLSCLIGRETQGDFERSVTEIARRYDDNCVFGLSGPWPPYSFVTLDLRV